MPLSEKTLQDIVQTLKEEYGFSDEEIANATCFIDTTDTINFKGVSEDE